MKKIHFYLLLIIAGISFGVLSSCRFNCVKGSGKQISETRKTEEFRRIDVSGGFKVNLKQDSSNSLTINADDNLLKYIKTSVEGGRLRIYTKRNLCNSGQITVNVGFRTLDELKGSGAIEFVSDGKVNTQDLHIELSGACKVNMELNADNVRTEGSGATEIMLKGQASSHNIELSGTGKVNALDFVVGSYNIHTSGASHCQINVLKELNVHTSGASEIQYRGNPSSVNNDKSGASSITKID
jgi:hypothetical protein